MYVKCSSIKSRGASHPPVAATLPRSSPEGAQSPLPPQGEPGGKGTERPLSAKSWRTGDVCSDDITRTTRGARIASGGACDKLFHIGTDDLRGLFGACRPRPRTAANSCGAFSFLPFCTKTSKTQRLRVGTASHLHHSIERENRHRDITPQGVEGTSRSR